MTNDRKLHFWVGLFCLTVLAALGAMVFQFGKMGQYFRPRYAVAVHFTEAPGLFAHSPVLLNGITIGSVREVKLDEQRGGVLVLVEIEEKYKIRDDSQVYLRKSILGDSSLEFTPGQSLSALAPGALLDGEPPSDPLEIIGDLQVEVTKTLRTFNETAVAWEAVGKNLNNVFETNEGNIHTVLERTALSLNEFTQTMQKANQTLSVAEDLFADETNRENLRRTLASLPQLTEETARTISTVREAVVKIDAAAEKIGGNLDTLNEATIPLAKHSRSIVVRLDNTLANMETLSRELSTFAQLMSKEDGSLKKFIDDPELYNNLNRSALQLAIMLKNAEPMMNDLRIFSDKVARHPELIGVSGALKASSGLKDESEFENPPISNRPGTINR